MTVLDALPQPAQKRIALHVAPAAERALRAGHPWVFESAIRKQSREGAPGDLAVIFDAKDRFLAVGLYDPTSPIRVRVLQQGQSAAIDRAWFAARLAAAAAIRDPLVAQGTTGYRLVHGENDGLPGLILDRYADTLVLKLYTAAWLPHLRDVLAALDEMHPSPRLILRLSRGVADLAAPYGLSDGLALVGDAPDAPVIFEENGLRFAADVVHGHKTGFFFDQRDNRARVRDLAAGRRVLDVFAYSGGFSVYAAAGGAESVLSVDVSAPALEAAAANMALNADNPHVQAAKHDILAEDAFVALERLRAEGQVFDLVIVDPPSFAKSAAEVDRALASYARLARLAVGLAAEDGMIVLASCSSRVTPDQFFETVTRAADDVGRPLVWPYRTGHALDHPVGFPEGEYLKCLYATVMDE
jgi:23S rRNA (cytosine1962-C5)-methyltransferase